MVNKVNEAVISGLRPALLYQVRVFAENELGRSKEGRVLQVRYGRSCVFKVLNSEDKVNISAIFRISISHYPLKEFNNKSFTPAGFLQLVFFSILFW